VMYAGLTANGLPAMVARRIADMPPIGVLFAAFLGYNPMRQLLGPLLGHLPAGHAAYVTGRQFFPHLITAPFHNGLGAAFGFAIAANVLAAVASLLTSPIRRTRAGRTAGTPRAARAESVGAELAAVAGEGGFEPSELVVPADDAQDAAEPRRTGPPRRGKSRPLPQPAIRARPPDGILQMRGG